MENKLQIFKNAGFGEIRTVVTDNEPWFVGKDIASILGYERDNKAVVDHVDEDDRKMVDGKTQSRFGIELGQRGGWLINESGLYSLILSSKLPTAKKFKRWVTSEVLPAIRKHGAYMTDDTIEKAITSPDFLIRLATELKEEKEKREAAELDAAQSKQIIRELQPKATYYDLVLQNKSTLSVTKIAKDYGKSAIWLNTRLHVYGIQYKRGDQWFLYQRYAKLGYTQSSTYIIDGEHSRMNTKWTQKGRLFIYELLKKHGVLPLIETGRLTLDEAQAMNDSDE